MKRGEAIRARSERVQNIYTPLARKIKEVCKCKTIIDIGCGLAEMVEAFQNLGIYAVGVDAAPVAYVPEKVRSHIKLANIASPDFLNLLGDWQGKRFDVALCLEVLEHLPENTLDVALSNIKALADVVIISTPKPNLWDNEDPTHLCMKPFEFWLERFSKAGYRPNEQLRCAIFGPNDLQKNPDSLRIVLDSSLSR